jgi:hypothetical protein
VPQPTTLPRAPVKEDKKIIMHNDLEDTGLVILTPEPSAMPLMLILRKTGRLVKRCP